MTPEEKTEITNKLRDQIRQDPKKTERQCGKLLKDVAWILIPKSEDSIYYVTCEHNFSSGKPDLIVIVNEPKIGGGKDKVAYIWELKAPQLPLFKIKTDSQACPSADLFEAENQLLHYHNTVKNSNWCITHNVDRVEFGGIIIGRDNNYVRYGKRNQNLCRDLADNALSIRKSYFYNPCSIRIMTWDLVLQNLENHTFSYQEYQGKPGRVINLKASINIRSSTSDVELQVENTED